MTLGDTTANGAGPQARAPKPEWKVIIDLLWETNPVLVKRIGRKMMNYLFKRGVKRIVEVMSDLLTKGSDGVVEDDQYADNRPVARIDYEALEDFIDEVFKVAEEELSADEITSMVSTWLRYENTRFLTSAAEKRDIPLAQISEALQRFMMLPESQRNLSPEETTGVRVALIRRFFTEDLDYINVVKKHVTVSDFGRMLRHTFGPASGNGKLGGKAAGLFRAERILHDARADNVVLRNLRVPRSWYIASDGILDFVHHNALEELLSIKYSDPSELRQEHIYLRQIFKNSFLPTEVMNGLSMAVDDFGDAPLIVRSSSLLEDSIGSAFAGKYKSIFVSNQGTKKEKVEALADAIVEVYASVFAPDPIEYRRERGLLDFHEEMAILIQEVVGRRVGDYFFPAYSGVAFSRNEFRWSPRIRRDDGVIRLVTGLGTRAVDRVGEDYPVLVSPGQPGLKVNISPDEIVRYSQKSVDVVNLSTRQFETVAFERLVQDYTREYPGLSYIISLFQEGNLVAPVGTIFNLQEQYPVVTFQRLITQSPFISQMRTMMQILEGELGFPVDIEFAYEGDIQTPCLLQCRPQSHSKGGEAVKLPAGLSKDDVLFTALRFVTTGIAGGIEYIVYVDPEGYDSLGSLEDLVEVGRVVSRLNSKLPGKKFILMGPGRWGSRGDIKLGVRVGYSDINNTAMLVEIARAKSGYVPDLSFGTHFFQDLVEADIKYLPLYPDDPGVAFNDAFFRGSPNQLRKFAPDAGALESVVRVIRVGGGAPDITLTVAMDGDVDRAIGYITRK
jgi:pyruvate,water dikinase